MEKYMVGENEVFFRSSGIIHIILRGEQTAEIARSFQDNHELALAKFGGPIDYLIDMNQAGKVTPKARRMVKDLALSMDTGKVAVFGAHSLAKFYANLVLSSFGRDNSRFFPTKEQAEDWLKTSAGKPAPKTVC
ncbi:MAG: STAS/SEC14 domain-containing protein [Bacteroidales bacterium]